MTAQQDNTIALDRPPGDGGISAIIAAIITAAAAAATTASSTLATELSKTGSKHVQGGTVDNLSYSELVLWKAAEPSHGAWAESPSAECLSIPTPQVAFEAWKLSGDAPEAVMKVTNVDDLGEAAKRLLSVWIDEALKVDATATFGLKSIGAGVDSMAIYHDAAKTVAFAFYLATPDIGDLKAGCTAADYAWMAAQIAKDDAEMSNLRDHIRDVDTTHTKLSEGESKRVTIGRFTVDFTAAQSVIFTLREQGVSL